MEAAGLISLPFPASIIIRSFLTGITGREKKWDKIIRMLLPWMIILGTAGPYCAVYAATMILVFGAAAVSWTLGQKEKLYLFSFLHPDSMLLLYILSNSFAVEEHAGATEGRWDRY